MNNNIELEELVKEMVDTKKDREKNLILYNDPVNTFDHVIFCLTVTCGHTPLQAEQCATIAHYNGKCVVKQGTYLQLEEMKYKLEDKNLTVEIK